MGTARNAHLQQQVEDGGDLAAGSHGPATDSQRRGSARGRRRRTGRSERGRERRLPAASAQIRRIGAAHRQRRQRLSADLEPPTAPRPALAAMTSDIVPTHPPPSAITGFSPAHNSSLDTLQTDETAAGFDFVTTKDIDILPFSSSEDSITTTVAIHSAQDKVPAEDMSMDSSSAVAATTVVTAAPDASAGATATGAIDDDDDSGVTSSSISATTTAPAAIEISDLVTKMGPDGSVWGPDGQWCQNETVLRDILQLYTHLRGNQFRGGADGRSDADCMVCECRYNSSRDPPSMACGEDSDCINRQLCMECPKNDCVTGNACQNRRFQLKQYRPIQVFRTEKKGFGLRAMEPIPKGTFIIEYCGEVLSLALFRKRIAEYSRNKARHFYFMSLKSKEFIDASKKANVSRFINHSCSPNCALQKWIVGSSVRIGIFAIKDIPMGTEISFDYQFERYGSTAQPCYCSEANCTGFIGGQRSASLTAITDSIDEDDEEEEEEYDDDNVDDDDDDEDGDDTRDSLTSERMVVSSQRRRKGKSKGKRRLVKRVPRPIQDEAELMEAARSIFFFSSRKLLWYLQCLAITTNPALVRKFLLCHGIKLMYQALKSKKATVESVRQVLIILKGLPVSSKNTLEELILQLHSMTLSDTWPDDIKTQIKDIVDVWEKLPKVYRIPKRPRNQLLASIGSGAQDSGQTTPLTPSNSANATGILNGDAAISAKKQDDSAGAHPRGNGRNNSLDQSPRTGYAADNSKERGGYSPIKREGSQSDRMPAPHLSRQLSRNSYSGVQNFQRLQSPMNIQQAATSPSSSLQHASEARTPASTEFKAEHRHHPHLVRDDKPWLPQRPRESPGRDLSAGRAAQQNSSPRSFSSDDSPRQQHQVSPDRPQETDETQPQRKPTHGNSVTLARTQSYDANQNTQYRQERISHQMSSLPLNPKKWDQPPTHERDRSYDMHRGRERELSHDRRRNRDADDSYADEPDHVRRTILARSRNAPRDYIDNFPSDPRMNRDYNRERGYTQRSPQRHSLSRSPPRISLHESGRDRDRDNLRKDWDDRPSQNTDRPRHNRADRLSKPDDYSRSGRTSNSSLSPPKRNGDSGARARKSDSASKYVSTRRIHHTTRSPDRLKKRTRSRSTSRNRKSTRGHLDQAWSSRHSSNNGSREPSRPSSRNRDYRDYDRDYSRNTSRKSSREHSRERSYSHDHSRSGDIGRSSHHDRANGNRLSESHDASKSNEHSQRSHCRHHHHHHRHHHRDRDHSRGRNSSSRDFASTHEVKRRERAYPVSGALPILSPSRFTVERDYEDDVRRPHRDDRNLVRDPPSPRQNSPHHVVHTSHTSSQPCDEIEEGEVFATSATTSGKNFSPNESPRESYILSPNPGSIKLHPDDGSPSHIPPNDDTSMDNIHTIDIDDSLFAHRPGPAERYDGHESTSIAQPHVHVGIALASSSSSVYGGTSSSTIHGADGVDANCSSSNKGNASSSHPMTNAERLTADELTVLKREIYNIVIKQLSKFRDQLSVVKFKDMARSLTKAVYDKELRSTRNKLENGAIMPTYAGGIKKWVKEYLSKHGFMQPRRKSADDVEDYNLLKNDD